ncbi:class I SAM-dependent methyltransferase [bacterium]|nr:class I SAM-dependent methyltransferase [bacterium]
MKTQTQVGNPGNLPTKKDVESFWSAHPCSGSKFRTIEELQDYRYRKDPVIRVFTSGLAKSPADRVLDIGCGQGADISDTLKKYSGTFGGDLSFVSLKNALSYNPSLKGRIVRFDAENLPYKPASFHAIYSHGVIHHSPHIARSVAEIFRILKPGGMGRVLLYSKYSPKGMAVRFCRILFRSEAFRRLLLRCFPNSGSAVDELFLCPVMDMHTRGDIRRLFEKFTGVKIEAWHIGLQHILFLMGLSDQNFLYRTAGSVEAAFERVFGFYWIVTFQKPA